jgi:capsular exopolysaccharide synthesis family protein
MSRIHEALKRAEQQRTSPSSTILQPQVPEAETHDGAAPPVRDIFDPLSHSDLGTTTTSAPSEMLRFDDVWNGCANPGWKLNFNLSVFANPDAPASAKEQFRTLRSRLYQIREKQPLRTVLVTSATAGEGKTVVASNLAQALVRQQECKVLLIDADLRCPELNKPLGAPSSPGLTDYLKREADEMAVVQRGLPEYLCFIAGGQRVENPAELLANGRLNSLLEKLAPVFDWVILDSPPTLPVSDALVLADQCDGVLTVVRAGYGTFESAQKACQQLHEKNVIGVVLNCADEDHANGAYYYYGGKNGHSGQ